jgi:hypothetical protein
LPARIVAPGTFDRKLHCQVERLTTFVAIGVQARPLAEVAQQPGWVVRFPAEIDL